MKNPFKKSSIVDTLVNVGLGGAANVAVDYAFENVDFLGSIAEHKNIIKIAAGVLAGTMIGGSYAKYVRPAADGVAIVGVSNLIAGYMGTDADPGAEPVTTSGAPFIGRPGVRLGQRGYRPVRGTGTVAFMEP